MLDNQTITKLDELSEQQALYRPADAIRSQLADKVAILVVGASCQGKNTVIQAVIQLDVRFHMIGTITSRPPRDSDHSLPYTYYEQTDKGLAPLLRAIDEHAVVQYAVNPYSRFVYASKLDDYPGQYNIGDYFSSAVAPFRSLGFRKAPAVTIISPPLDWMERFEMRFPLGHSDRQARRDEAIESLEWSLSQSTDHHWVINRTGQTTATARALITAVTQETELQPPDEAIQLAESTLRTARKLAV